MSSPGPQTLHNMPPTPFSDLDLTSTTPTAPHPQPLDHAYKGQGIDNIQRTARLTKTEKAALRTALQLGVQLIIHPRGLDIAANVMISEEQHHAIIRVAILRVLAELQVIIVVNEDAASLGSSKCVVSALHNRPDMEYNSFAARTIHMNPCVLERLVKVELKQSAAGQPTENKMAKNDWNIHLLATAVTIAHELIHVLRLQLHYRLLGRIDVPRATPPRIHAQGGHDDGEAGWDWEKQLFNGQLRTMWYLDKAKYDSLDTVLPPTDDSDAEDEDAKVAASGVRTTVRKVPAPTRKKEPFDTLVITREGKHYEIEPKWIDDAIDHFDEGAFAAVQFPPDEADCPTDGQLLSTLGRDEGRPRDIINQSDRRNGQSLEDVFFSS